MKTIYYWVTEIKMNKKIANRASSKYSWSSEY